MHVQVVQIHRRLPNFGPAADSQTDLISLFYKDDCGATCAERRSVREWKVLVPFMLQRSRKDDSISSRIVRQILRRIRRKLETIACLYVRVSCLNTSHRDERKVEGLRNHQTCSMRIIVTIVETKFHKTIRAIISITTRWDRWRRRHIRSWWQRRWRGRSRWIGWWGRLHRSLRGQWRRRGRGWRYRRWLRIFQNAKAGHRRVTSVLLPIECRSISPTQLIREGIHTKNTSAEFFMCIVRRKDIPKRNILRLSISFAI